MATTYKKRAQTDYIVVHCAATKPSQDIGLADIDRWHRAKGWNGCGYHYVIRRDGTTEFGRPVDTIGAHVEGHNSTSVGICMAGGIAENGQPEDNFTKEQRLTLVVLLKGLQKAYPKAVVQGHRDFPGVKKACPSFDVKKWLAQL